MVTDFFGSMLQELAKALQLAKLEPDTHNSCTIKFKGGLHLQLEIDRSEMNLIIAADLDTIPAGKFREDVFREALRSNGLPPPNVGIFAYSKQTDHLVLFEMHPIKDLNGIRVAELLSPLIDKARIWKEAISRGEIPHGISSKAQAGGGIFGLHP